MTTITVSQGRLFDDEIPWRPQADALSAIRTLVGKWPPRENDQGIAAGYTCSFQLLQWKRAKCSRFVYTCWLW